MILKSFAFVCGAALALLGAAACGGTSGTGTTSGAGGAGADTFDCFIPEQTAFNAQCQRYEASGPDAATVIAELKTQCNSQAGVMMSVSPCPTAGVLGGCKAPVQVKGGNAQLEVTTFFYPGTSNPVDPETTAAVQSQCASDGSQFVASP